MKTNQEGKMRITRYINGKQVSGEELSRAGIMTKALENAVRDARKRAEPVQRKEDDHAEG